MWLILLANSTEDVSLHFNPADGEQECFIRKHSCSPSNEVDDRVAKRQEVSEHIWVSVPRSTNKVTDAFGGSNILQPSVQYMDGEW